MAGRRRSAPGVLSGPSAEGAEESSENRPQDNARLSQNPENEPAAESIEVLGTVGRFTFRNPDNGFGVGRLTDDESGAEWTIVGSIAQLAEGQKARIRGRLQQHNKFGTQLEVESAQTIQPTSVDGIRTYLASGLVKGIGPATAERIVAQFGERTLEVIEHEPDRLAGVQGLGDRKIQDLVTAIDAHKGVNEVLAFLRAHGLGQGLAARIVKRYGKNAAGLVEADPFRLVDDVIGIGFKTADRLARDLGLASDAPERIQAGMLHTLSQAASRGDCYVPVDELVPRVAELLEVPPESVRPNIDVLVVARRVVRERAPGPGPAPDRPEIVYPLKLHLAETGVAKACLRLARLGRGLLPLDAGTALSEFCRTSRMELSDGQHRALVAALTEPISVITGGPGVGKTTILRALAWVFAQHELQLKLAAPTGRAAKRLEESTGHEASTVHRLLEYQSGLHKFARNAEQPLEGAMLVVDEASMLDIQLADHLFRAVPPTMRLVLVGDVDQLPSVGAGNVLHDIIESGQVAVTHLHEIFRQQRDSEIIRCAHGILRGEVPQPPRRADSDCYFIASESPERTRDLVRHVVAQRIPQAFGLDPMRDVQVLCPMYRGAAGADALNVELQDVLNPDGGIELERGGKRYRVGDKVMQVRNDYDLDVFNGDTGRIERIDKADGKLTVAFGERTVEYGFNELDQLVPAYAITIHRAQGSEYPAVVVPVLTEHFLMLRRNLLYTAVTRGRRLVVLIGAPRALQMAVEREDGSQRRSTLAARLRGTVC